MLSPPAPDPQDQRNEKGEHRARYQPVHERIQAFGTERPARICRVEEYPDAACNTFSGLTHSREERCDRTGSAKHESEPEGSDECGDHDVGHLIAESH